MQNNQQTTQQEDVIIHNSLSPIYEYKEFHLCHQDHSEKVITWTRQFYQHIPKLLIITKDI